MIVHRFRILFLAAVLAAGCTSKKEERLDMRVHIPEVEIKLDPHKMEDAFSMMILSQLDRIPITREQVISIF